jgi:hypothetical protein
MEIEQFVVGTGGADLDKDKGAIIGEDIDLDIGGAFSFTYNIEETKPVNGFLDCIFFEKGDEILFEPVFVGEPTVPPTTPSLYEGDIKRESSISSFKDKGTKGSKRKQSSSKGGSRKNKNKTKKKRHTRKHF